MSHPYAWARALTEREWLGFLAGEIVTPGKVAPPMPPADFQKTWIGRSGLDALSEGAVFLNHVRSVIPSLPPGARILDFGCGWARLYRILMREVFSLVGADSEPFVVQMCRDALPNGEFLQVATAPPYPFNEAEFDLIYAFSIFSHLAEPVARRIYAEFGRLLKPGAHLAITLLQANQVDRWETERQSPDPALRTAIEKAQFDLSAWKARSAVGEFLYLPTGGGYDSMSADNYGWAYMSRPCLIRMLTDLPLHLVDVVTLENLPQDIAIIRRLS